MSDDSPIGGIAREDITVPGTFRATCVACEDRRFFNPDRNTDGGLRYSCQNCGHEVALLLNPEQ